MTQTYIFFRHGGSFPLECVSDQEAKHVAETNEGISRVQKLDGNVIWADNNRLPG